MSKVLIVGGGAAGMMAGIAAAENGNEVHLFEKNEKLGKKLFITGKGRCNITNACDMEELMKQVVTNPRFLYSAFKTFDNMAVMDFFEESGLPLKTERGQRVFPQSDHSSDVIRTLQKELEKRNVSIHLNTEVKEIISENGQFCSIRTKEGQISGDACIVATGGLSYQSTFRNEVIAVFGCDCDKRKFCCRTDGINIKKCNIEVDSRKKSVIL